MLRLLLFFTLVFVVNQLHFHWETGIPGLAPINILIVLIVLAFRGQPDELADVRPALLRPLLYFFAALTFAFLLAQLRDPRNFIDDLTYLKNAIFFPLFYFVFLKCRQDAKNTRYLIIWIMVVAAVAGLEAVREGIDYGFGKYNAMRRASGPFGEDWHMANRAGVFYAMFTPMFIALAMFLKKQKVWRLAAVAGAVLLSAGALFTYSRQSYFLILLALAVLLVRKSIVFAAVVTVALVSLAGYLPDSVTQRVDETTQSSSKSGSSEVDESTSSRWEIWAGAMGMVKDHPIGVGLNRFKVEIGNYCSHRGYDAHNFYVLTLAEMGPQGLAALLYLMGSIFFGLAAFLRQKVPADDPEAKALALGFTVCTLCMALGGIYGSPTLEGAVMAPYWALCGLLERYVYLKERSADSGPTEPEIEPTLAERFPLASYIEPGRRR
jgi:O-antigen ligase